MAVYTYPSKKALASITAKVRALTNRARHRTLADLLRQLNAALRGWCNYFRHGVSAATFRYLGQLAWRRVTIWLRKRHPRSTWKQLRHRYLSGAPGWRPVKDGIELFYPSRWRSPATAGEQPTSPHPGRAWRRHSPPHSNKGTRGAPVAWRRARRVRRTDRETGRERSRNRAPVRPNYNAKLCLNGHEWVKRQATKAGIAFTALDNGFATVEDPAALQAICDHLGPEQIDGLLRKWLAILPHRLLGVQRLSHNPIRAEQAFTAVHDPIITADGHRIAGLCLGDRRAHALLQALLMFRLLPDGFLNRDLRGLLAGLLGKDPEDISAGQVSYDLRRLRAHGLIARIPRTHRYRISDTGLHHAMLITHLHTRLLQPGLAQLTDPDPPAPSAQRTAARNYQQALDQLTQEAGFAA